MFKIKLITMPVFIGRESLCISGYQRILVASHILEATSSLYREIQCESSMGYRQSQEIK